MRYDGGEVHSVKLILAVVSARDAGRLSIALADRGLRNTRLSSTGGFLREGNATLLIGCEDDVVEDVLELVRATARSRKQPVLPLAYLGEEAHPIMLDPVDTTVGGATAFVLGTETVGIR